MTDRARTRTHGRVPIPTGWPLPGIPHPAAAFLSVTFPFPSRPRAPHQDEETARMEHPGMRQVAHEITIAVPADTVHRLIAEVGNWPRIFPSVIHVEYEEAPEGEERLTIWETAPTAAGEPRCRPLRRIVEPAKLRVNFQHLVTASPVAGLGGAWLVEPLGEDTSRVRLLHEFRAAADDPGALDRIGAEIDRSAVAELAALKENAEREYADAEWTF